MNRLYIFMTLCAILALASCKSHEEHHEAETKYLVTSPVRKDTSINKDYVCQIHAIQHIELRAQERGYLQNIYIDEGKFVKEGDLLFQIMPRLYEAELKKAEAEVNFAQIEYNNTKRLADSNVVAPNELAMAAAKLQKANAELALAKVHLDFTQLRAPFSGIIDRFHVRLGSLIDEGDLLTELSDNSKMWVYFNVPEAEYLEYESHAKTEDQRKVYLIMANSQKFDQVGIVETIEADFNNETGNIAFRATFPNPKGLLRHGETGNIEMVIRLKNALLIPQKAIFDVLDKRYVFVLDAENKLRSRQITVGSELPHLSVVTSGLEESDKILLEGLRKVREGQEIAYEFQDPNEVINHLELYAE
ncbi:MAG: efflux RND transporter periplasmic adaptor subunit [Bacteroidia bacterium]|nr:efflux RND transporter periplasmic adaptor subunit [Bacteroidia bacterium]